MSLSRSQMLAILVGLFFIYSLIYPFVKKTPEVSFPPPPDFKSFAAGSERKNAFFDYFTPIVAHLNSQLMQKKTILMDWSSRKTNLSSTEIEQLNALAHEFDIEDFDRKNPMHWKILERRVDIVPLSLTLAQAANESAWGTSRFAQKANNYFGQWCFSKGCGLVPSARAQGKSHEVAAFNSPLESVYSYMMNINTHRAYTDLRVLREKLRARQQPVTGVSLAAGLSRYSERGEAYIKEIRAMIRHNKLE
ncbi:glucosaminidase domain-containing protein [Gayadomonas joobiniege]|uniref:glucosaminidase domain-containing protein n=1 Tax=Gayadomonas joobiniege TaxID=1234606 RepID=UPI00036B82AD|nr:glucosaminidase domain-containing protein [Gayadomonas joobiniege]